MTCPMCGGNYTTPETKHYDNESITKIKCHDCSHEFHEEDALPRDYRIPTVDRDHHE